MTTTPPSDAGAEAVLESLAAQVNKQLDMSDDALFGYLKAYGNPETPPHEVENAYRRLGALAEKRTRKRGHHQDRNHRYLAHSSPAG